MTATGTWPNSSLTISCHVRMWSGYPRTMPSRLTYAAGTCGGYLADSCEPRLPYASRCDAGGSLAVQSRIAVFSGAALDDLVVIHRVAGEVRIRPAGAEVRRGALGRRPGGRGGPGWCRVPGRIGRVVAGARDGHREGAPGKSRVQSLSHSHDAIVAAADHAGSVIAVTADHSLAAAYSRHER